MRQITIFRPSKAFGVAMRVHYYIDGETEVASAKNGETVKFDLDENKHTLRAHVGVFSKGTGSDVITIDAGDDNKEYEFYFGPKKMFSSNPILTERKP